MQVEVASGSTQPIFVGVAPPAELKRYLADVGYTTVRELDGGDVSRVDHDGAAPATPPAGAIKWTDHAEGTATQTLRWDATAARQIVFAMNADGSRPVHVRIVSSAVTLDQMPWWLPAGVLAIGVVVAMAAVAVLRRTGSVTSS